MSKLKGITGKILRVNLTTQTTQIESYSSELVQKYLGGRGLAAYYLFKEVDPNSDALSEQNKLIFFNGPLAGTLIPGNNKVNVSFKSPLSNTYSYSLCGGHWGPELKYAGYDGLIIEGKSQNPVYLWIKNDHIELKSAKKLWGTTIPKAEEIIQADLSDESRLQSAIIGPAGENLTKFATITAGLSREFGRGGAGAVMGSKNLKAIVISGSQGFIVDNMEKMTKIGSDLIKKLRKSAGGQVRRKYGTPEMVEKINENGFWVTKNFQASYFEQGKQLEGPAMREAIVVGDASCFGCPVGCGKRSQVESDKFGNILLEGPEFETIGMLGANCEISDWETLLKATQICDVYGFDTMNAGGCVAFAMECFENGILTTEDTQEIELRFGSNDALIKTLEMIAHREAIGDLLAEGLQTAGEKLNAEKYAIQSKGQAFAVYDPRGCKAMALTYATSPKGAHHMVATTMGHEINTNTLLEYKGKAELERQHQFSMAIVDSLGLCATMRAGLSLHDQAQAISVITGQDFDEMSLMLIAERIVNLERLYNIRLGLDREDDTLPSRFLSEPIPSGPSKGETVDLDRLLDDFYSVMDWDITTGIPTKSKLQDLDLWDLYQDKLL